MHYLFIMGLTAAVVYLVLLFSNNTDNFLSGFCLGITLGMMIVGVIMTSRNAAKLRAFKLRLLHRLK